MNLSRITAVFAAVTLAVSASAAPTWAQPGSDADRHPTKRPHTKQDKLGSHDRDLLVKAVRDKKSTVRAMLAVDPASFAAARKDVEAAGGTVDVADAKLGYLRATLPTTAVDTVAQKGSVRAVDLDEQIKLADPVPRAEGRGMRVYGAPGAKTPASNPYLPVNETGAVDFTKAHPTWDGRGVTIGILDSGVDLDHPALATTTTGERKIVDWVTATDPVTEGDATWLRMTEQVSGASFERYGQVITTPGAGDYRIADFYEYGTLGDNEINGDVDRDGSPWGSWAVLYREADHAIWVDADADGDFAEEPLMRPYRDAHQVGHFGPTPFVVEWRAHEGGDFVNIGISADSHGSHVAGIAAGRGLFGGAMRGAAPGAKIVSARACTWQGGCTAVALTEGMIDLVANRGVDVVNMSIGGLPALNDGANARTHLYNALIDTYGVQIFLSAGNEGSGVNTVGDPAGAAKAITVGASISRDTWAADYGADVATRMGVMNFSSRGPREDGGFKPDIVAPGAAVSAITHHLPGQAVAEAGYALPDGYGMFNGTSMASPQAAGAAALLLSAAKATTGRRPSPARLRTAVFGGARQIAGAAVHEQGNGLVDVAASWRLLQARDLASDSYVIDAPVCTPLSDLLARPGRGEGLYDRCGGRTEKFSDVTVTRTSGPAGVLKHELSWLGDKAFGSDPGAVWLPLNKPVTVRVHAKPKGNGAHSAILQIDNPATAGVDARMMATVVTADEFTAPGYATSRAGVVAKAQSDTFFVTVPEHAKTLQVNLSGVAKGSRVRFVAQHPWGVPAETGCYTDQPEQGCDDALVRSFSDPMPGVWEIVVESARTSPVERNPYRLDVRVFGVGTDDHPALGILELHQAAPVSWTVTNHFGAVDLGPSTTPLASRYQARPVIGDQEEAYSFVTVPLGATRFEATIGNPAQAGADLDLLVATNGVLIGQSADADSEESVVIENPPAGRYQIIVIGYAVPGGSTEFDYRDEMRTGTLGKISTTFAEPIHLDRNGSARVDAAVTAAGIVPAGRSLHGTLDLRNTDGAVVGQADVAIAGVDGPAVHLAQVFGPMNAYTAGGSLVGGSKQIDAVSVPTTWRADGGFHHYTGYNGHLFALNGKGDGAGMAEHEDGSASPAVFHADGRVTELPMPHWSDDELYGRAFGIADDGTVIGTITSWSWETSFVNEPFRWTATGGYQRLEHLSEDRTSSEPLGVNNAGVVVGVSHQDGRPVACWWDAEGKVHEIGVLGADNSSVLFDINDAGVAVGSSGERAVKWTLAGGLERLPDLGFHSEARQIRNDGWIAGSSDAAPYDPHAVAWDPKGALFDLNALLAEQDRFYIAEPVGINDEGFVVYGQALDGSDANIAVLRF